MENVSVNYLYGQKRKIFEVMQEKDWFTLRDIESKTGILQTSISANLRVMKSKTEFVSDIHKRKNKEGMIEYQMIPTNREEQ